MTVNSRAPGLPNPSPISIVFIYNIELVLILNIAEIFLAQSINQPSKSIFRLFTSSVNDVFFYLNLHQGYQPLPMSKSGTNNVSRDQVTNFEEAVNRRRMDNTMSY